MSKEIKVVELFAGVGGFRLGLDGYSNPKYPDFDMEPAAVTSIAFSDDVFQSISCCVILRFSIGSPFSAMNP